jgi:hypothetical protein
LKNQRKFLDWAATQLNVKDMSDWYHVSYKVNVIFVLLWTIFQDIVKIGGYSLLKSKYNHSPSAMLRQVYSEYEWLPWKFDTCPTYFWDDPKNQRKFLEWASKQLSVKDMSDWYSVTYKVKINIAFL